MTSLALVVPEPGALVRLEPVPVRETRGFVDSVRGLLRTARGQRRLVLQSVPRGNPMRSCRFTLPMLLAFGTGGVFTAGCSGGDTTSGPSAGASAAGSGGSSGRSAASSGSGGTATDHASGGANGGSAGHASSGAGGGAGQASGGGGASAGGRVGSGGASPACTGQSPLSACPARGSQTADNCQQGATCCDSTQERQCFCAAETCTFYFGI